MENKQTAVEWLVDKIKLKYDIDFYHIKNEINQALEMEKKQNLNEFERGFLKCADTLQNILNKGLK